MGIQGYVLQPKRRAILHKKSPSYRKIFTKPLRILLLGFLLLTFPASPIAQQKQPGWKVYFSPKGGCTEATLKELDRAKTIILGKAVHERKGQEMKRIWQRRCNEGS